MYRYLHVRKHTHIVICVKVCNIFFWKKIHFLAKILLNVFITVTVFYKQYHHSISSYIFGAYNASTTFGSSG